MGVKTSANRSQFLIQNGFGWLIIDWIKKLTLVATASVVAAAVVLMMLALTTAGWKRLIAHDRDGVGCWRWWRTMRYCRALGDLRLLAAVGCCRGVATLTAGSPGWGGCCWGRGGGYYVDGGADSRARWCCRCVVFPVFVVALAAAACVVIASPLGRVIGWNCGAGRTGIINQCRWCCCWTTVVVLPLRQCRERLTFNGFGHRRHLTAPASNTLNMPTQPIIEYWSWNVLSESDN